MSRRARPPIVGAMTSHPQSSRLLVVADRTATRDAVAGILERGGHTVTEARDAQDAITLIAQTRFDAMVIAPAPGSRTCATILDSPADCPAAVVTLDCSSGDDEPETGGHAATVLRAPWALSELYDAVARAAAHEAGKSTVLSV